jgi:hypothetical protein
MPSRFPEQEGLVELQVTFVPRRYKEILLLSTVDINKEKPSFRGLNSDELALLAGKFPTLLPKYIIHTGHNNSPMAITYTYCNTGASLWEIYPTVEEKADFSNAVGG